MYIVNPPYQILIIPPYTLQRIRTKGESLVLRICTLPLQESDYYIAI